MAGRDLLYKPDGPSLPGDEQGGGPADERGVGRGGEGGVERLRGRDPGGVAGDTPARSAAASPRGARWQAETKAYEAPYFTEDVSGVRQVNQRARDMRALRGAEGVTDLQKVVLPRVAGAEGPDPARLAAAAERMGLSGGAEIEWKGLVGRQASWTHGGGVTAETIQGRMAQLARMIDARRAALRRMAARVRRGGCVTAERAWAVQDGTLERADDLGAEGRDLVERTAAQAQGMHRRLLELLRLKRG